METHDSSPGLSIRDWFHRDEISEGEKLENI